MHQRCFWLLKNIWRWSAPNSTYDAGGWRVHLSSTATQRRQVKRSVLPAVKNLNHELQAKLESFQRGLLRGSLHNTSYSQRTSLWKAYESLKQQSRQPLSFVPRSVWNRFWKLLTLAQKVDAAHLIRLQVLIDDMKAATVNINRFEQAFQIEKSYFEDDMIRAFKIWLQGPDGKGVGKSVTSTLVKVESSYDEYDSNSLNEIVKERLQDVPFDQDWLELGIKIFSAMGNAECVASIVAHLGSRVRTLDPRSSVYVSLALNYSKAEAQTERAWTVFNTALSSPSYRWSFTELEAVCQSFLTVESLPYATSVLYLMAAMHKLSAAQAQLVFGKFFSRILAKVESIEQVDEVSLDLLKYLPDTPIQNSFFDAWLKASTRLGHPDHTSEIIELMFERGKSPKARHLDWLLRAWIDAKENNKVVEIETLALSMIKQRLELAEDPEPGSPRNLELAPRLPKYLKRSLPAANTRTFILLMKHYAKAGDNDAAKKTLRLVELISSSMLDAQMTRAILTIHFTMADMSGGWRFFMTMRNDGVLKCDQRCLAILWKGMNLQLVSSKSLNRDGFPDPRQLFAIMLQDLSADQDLAEPFLKDGPNPTAYERIIHCFCLAEDTPGLLLALHSLKAMFNIHPTQKTVLSVAQHISHRRALHLATEDSTNTFQGIVQQETLQSMAVLQRIWKRMQDQEPSRRFLSYAGVFEKPKPSLRRPRRDIEQARGEELLLLLTLFIKNYLPYEDRLARRFDGSVDKARADMKINEYPKLDAIVEELRRLSS